MDRTETRDGEPRGAGAAGSDHDEAGPGDASEPAPGAFAVADGEVAATLDGQFAKVYAALWQGTLGCSWEAWSLFVYMLANCDPHGRFDQTPEYVARVTSMPLDAVRRGIEVLEAPDAESRSTAYDGRRIVRLSSARSWGWRLVNYRRYRVATAATGDDAAGYVYYVGLRDGAAVRIGFSKNPWARLKDLRVKSPAVMLYGLERGTPTTERERHFQFQAARQSGDWYSLTPELRAHLATLAHNDGRDGSTTAVATKRQRSEAEEENTTPTPTTPPPAPRSAHAAAEPALDLGVAPTPSKPTKRAARGAGAREAAAPVFGIEVAADATDSPFAIPTNRSGWVWVPSEDGVAEWSRLFPGVDVPAQLRAARAWSLANPKKRKTVGGMEAFVVGWLGREQNRGGRGGAGERPQSGHRPRVRSEYVETNLRK